MCLVGSLCAISFDPLLATHFPGVRAWSRLISHISCTTYKYTQCSFLQATDPPITLTRRALLFCLTFIIQQFRPFLHSFAISIWILSTTRGKPNVMSVVETDGHCFLELLTVKSTFCLSVSCHVSLRTLTGH